jgi:hypothetical protein
VHGDGFGSGRPECSPAEAVAGVHGDGFGIPGRRCGCEDVPVSSTPGATPQPPVGPRRIADAIPHDLRAAAVFTVDLVAVVVFVLLGRFSHGEDEALTGVLITLWPFLCGMLVGWLVLLLTGTRPVGYPAGAIIVVSTVVVGMVLRGTISHSGTPVTFVIAAAAFLTLCVIGWRSVAHLVRSRTNRSPTPEQSDT